MVAVQFVVHVLFVSVPGAMNCAEKEKRHAAIFAKKSLDVR